MFAMLLNPFSSPLRDEESLKESVFWMQGQYRPLTLIIYLNFESLIWHALGVTKHQLHFVVKWSSDTSTVFLSAAKFFIIYLLVQYLYLKLYWCLTLLLHKWQTSKLSEVCHPANFHTTVHFLFQANHQPLPLVPPTKILNFLAILLFSLYLLLGSKCY